MDYNYNPYEILGIAENATPQEIEEKYLQLREKYQKDRFLPGEAGEEASEKLQQIEVAYRDILLAKEESKQTQDFKEEEDSFEIITAPEDFDSVRNALSDAQIPMVEAEISMIPQNYVSVTDPEAVKGLRRTLDLLDEDDDVQNYYTNWEEE